MNTYIFSPYARHTVFVTSSHEIASLLGKLHCTVVRHIERMLADDPGWAHQFDCNVDLTPGDRWYALSYQAAEEMAFIFRKRNERERLCVRLANLAGRSDRQSSRMIL